MRGVWVGESMHGGYVLGECVMGGDSRIKRDGGCSNMRSLPFHTPLPLHIHPRTLIMGVPLLYNAAAMPHTSKQTPPPIAMMGSLRLGG